MQIVKNTTILYEPVLENDKQLKCEALMYSTRPKMISDVFDVAINFNLKMNNQALNSHLFYHRGNG